MVSRVVRLLEQVCCVVCGRAIAASEARIVDRYGPVSVCWRCPNPDPWHIDSARVVASSPGPAGDAGPRY
jgi:hypothetical protein